MQEIRQYHYRAAIHKAVPNVRILDDEAFLVEKVGGQLVIRDPPESHRAKKVPDHLRTDWQLVSEGIKAINVDEQEDSACRCLFGQYLYCSVASCLRHKLCMYVLAKLLPLQMT